MHTILLIQKTTDKRTRTYADYETVAAAVEDVIKMYEERLKELNPRVRNINYDVSDLHKYIDYLGDVAALVLDPRSNTYRPHDKDWIKEKCFQHLKKWVQGSETRT